MTQEFVILVDENDNETGVMEKMEAHKKAALHRAVSVFIFNSKGEWMLQQRAFEQISFRRFMDKCMLQPSFPWRNSH
jgi:isopentenyl-diphosphate Delta-isomerase